MYELISRDLEPYKPKIKLNQVQKEVGDQDPCCKIC